MEKTKVIKLKKQWSWSWDIKDIGSSLALIEKKIQETKYKDKRNIKAQKRRDCIKIEENLNNQELIKEKRKAKMQELFKNLENKVI